MEEQRQSRRDADVRHVRAGLIVLFVLGLSVCLYDLTRWPLLALGVVNVAGEPVAPLQGPPIPPWLLPVLAARGLLHGLMALGAVWLHGGHAWAARLLIGGLVGCVALFAAALALTGLVQGPVAAGLQIAWWFPVCAAELLGLGWLTQERVRAQWRTPGTDGTNKRVDDQ